MQTNLTLVGIFVRKHQILSFLERLKNHFHIWLEKVFVYEASGNQKEYLVTFKTNDKERIIKALPSALLLHRRNGSMFSINALNKLIEEETGRKNDVQYSVDWEKYADKLIILANDKLTINDLEKVENWLIFFK